MRVSVCVRACVREGKGVYSRLEGGEGNERGTAMVVQVCVGVCVRLVDCLLFTVSFEEFSCCQLLGQSKAHPAWYILGGLISPTSRVSSCAGTSHSSIAGLCFQLNPSLILLVPLSFIQSCTQLHPCPKATSDLWSKTIAINIDQRHSASQTFIACCPITREQGPWAELCVLLS